MSAESIAMVTTSDGKGMGRMMAGVILLHGISRSRRSMSVLERRIAAEGYVTANLDYPSRRVGLGELADWLAPQVAAFAAALDGPVHFVTHSMGGLVARALIARHRPERLGRVVMLAPPNGGSEIADRLRGLGPYRWWFGPAGAQLGIRRDPALAALFGSVDYPLGVIAGNRSVYPFASALLPSPHDGRVSVDSTAVEGMADHLVLPTSHLLIIRNGAAIAQVLAFLHDGRFRLQAPAAPPRRRRGDGVPAS